jgi:hypothetical protein
MLRKLSIFALLAIIVVGLLAFPQTHASAACGATNIALNKPATASTTQSGLSTAAGVDGNAGTRWGSDWADPQWFQVDLGTTQN